MRLDVVPVRSFDGSSRVSAYWLANCEGFRVRHGRRRGVVLDVALDAATARTDYLVVRFGIHRVTVEVDDVETVVPARELLVLRPPGRRAPRVAPAAGRARERAGHGARRAGQLSGRTASAAARATVRFAALAAYRTRRLSTWLAPRASHAGRVLAHAGASGAMLVLLALARVARTLHALGAAALARLSAELSGHRADGGAPAVGDDASGTPDPGRTREHAA